MQKGTAKFFASGGQFFVVEALKTIKKTVKNHLKTVKITKKPLEFRNISKKLHKFCKRVLLTNSNFARFYDKGFSEIIHGIE